MTAAENVNAMGATGAVKTIASDVAGTYSYYNRNTGQVVEYAQRSSRLDALDNWELVASPPPPKGKAAEADDPVVPVAVPVTRPADHEPKKEWTDYAISRGMPEAQARALSKQALIDTFGKGA
ncbi:hypothetical protein ACIBH1_45130 [Nonomuraea sp. NPDC050663]|uniref:hypothetical protein n=1 Tax=Nonomuraea sp. NPDC050663 TaxID=3364370 RepID=UPI0037A44BB2